MKCSIVGAAYLGRSIGVDGQECVNLYPEGSASNEAKAAITLIGTPGLRKLVELGTSSMGCRGLFTTARNRLLAVVGSILYEVKLDKSVTVLGNLLTHQGPVSFAEVDKQIDPISAAVSTVFIVDGQHGYNFNTQTNVLSAVTANYLPGNSVVSQNGYFIQNLNNSNKFTWTNLDTWDVAGSFLTAESSPDPILWMTLVNNQLYLFGAQTTEIWTYTGNSLAPWSRSGVGFIQTGIAGRYAGTVINGHVFWVGSNQNGQNIIWESGSSYMANRVSTHAIEYIIGQMDKIDDCVAMSYQREGHQFVIFNFPTGNRTLCFDMTTQLWHERGTFDTATGVNNRHVVEYLTNWNNQIVVAGSINNNLYTWELDQYTDDGLTIQRVRTAPHIHDERYRVFFNSMEVDLEKGTAAQGEDPQLMLRYSNDGGYNYSPNEIWASVGQVGDRLIRARFKRLGQSRDRVFRLVMTDPIRWILIDGRMDAKPEKP